MSRKTKSTTKSDQIRTWLQEHPAGTRAEFMAASGIPVSHGQFSTLRKARQGRTPDLQSDLQPNFQNELDILKTQNEFLKWWCIGERKGFIDKLLKELNKD